MIDTTQIFFLDEKEKYGQTGLLDNDKDSESGL